jgi:hypothetical protein
LPFSVTRTACSSCCNMLAMTGNLVSLTIIGKCAHPHHHHHHPRLPSLFFLSALFPKSVLSRRDCGGRNNGLFGDYRDVTAGQAIMTPLEQQPQGYLAYPEVTTGRLPPFCLKERRRLQWCHIHPPGPPCWC